MHLKQARQGLLSQFLTEGAVVCHSIIPLNKEAPDPDLTQSKPIPSRGKYGSSCNLSQYAGYGS